MTRFNRRTFLAQSAALGASAALSARSYANVAGANGDVRLAVVGLNGKGRDHVTSFEALPGVRVVALCDCDSAALDNAAQIARKAGAQVKTFIDYRELLAQKDIDAVSIVTPNHQHAIQGIWALQAGKDVFLEKPVSHDLWEGQQLVRAAEKYPTRIMQAGTQNRSSPPIAEALAWQREGHIGRVLYARGLCYKRRASIGKSTSAVPVPATVNYDLWLGPAPQTPLKRQKFHYDWHWQWATGNGDIGNQGNHQLDVARRFLGEAALPPRVIAIGGRFGYEDDGETPNTLLVLYDYPKAPLIFEVRGLPAKPGADTMDQHKGLSVGVIVECEGGSIAVPAGDYTSAQAFDREGKLIRDFKGKGDHYANFIQAAHSRKASELTAPIREGHVSSGLSHLPNISLRSGKDVTLAQAKQKLEGPSSLGEAFARMSEHLKVNGVDLARTPLRFGMLTLDPATERFTGPNAEAATLLARQKAREPFVLPALG